MESYGIAAFRSRQSVLRFDEQLRTAGIPTRIISTPRAISMGCGLSVRFERRSLSSVLEIYKTHPLDNLIGFYLAISDEGKIDIRSIGV